MGKHAGFFGRKIESRLEMRLPSLSAVFIFLFFGVKQKECIATWLTEWIQSFCHYTLITSIHFMLLKNNDLQLGPCFFLF